MLTPDDAAWTRPLGITGLTVTAVGLGASPLGGMPAAYSPGDERVGAVDLVRAVLRSPIRLLDTSNGYRDSERHIGAALAAEGGLPDDVLLATKVDPLGDDYSGDRVRASLAESRERLGVDHLPLVHLHDPEGWDFDELSGPGGAVEALVAAKESGAVGRIGLAGGDVHQIRRYLDLGVFDVLLVHNRLTLVDRSAEELVQDAVDRGLAVVNAAIYGGGVLGRQEAPADGSPEDYAYEPAHPATARAIRDLRALCARHGTDLPTVALQHSLRDPRVSTTLVGMTRVERVEQVLAAAAADVPEELWAEAEALVPPREAWVDHRSR
ncbi:aldo/keto reductase [Pseudokineococcus lusitanus]|uniref:D-threo-aldose 1-dehydrogenase n=1 Tax=Pseudokineococcus lusitanus TaxID=763993 RepID=A0A3N1GWG4_9ACTN|nr:aldo/keto reductase [Pseudokineococcus lusitanus]ROP34554.1 D-threo-aldose 1-dehydrogenase [Pseudokineococcus lusitanus]